MGTRKVGTVARSISLSYSGNLVAYTTTLVSQARPMLFIADLRDSSQLNSEQASGHVTLNHSSNCCVFSHLEDAIIVGKFLHTLMYITIFDFRRRYWIFEPV